MSEIDQQKKIQQAKDELKKVNDLLSQLEALRIETPQLNDAVGRLATSIEIGVDIAQVCFEVSKALEDATRLLIKQCNGDPQCEYKFEGGIQKQNKALYYVLNWNNKNSVVRSSVRKVICEKSPFDIAKVLRWCSE